jgi:hypothetical protein
VFAVLTAIYGQKWTSLVIDEQMLVDMQTVWGHHLRDINLDQVKIALDRLPREYPNWPPTVGQFAELCEACAELCEACKVVPYNPQLPKPRTEASEKVALKALAEIKGILK